MDTKDFCPKCNWADNYFDGTYYRVEDNEQIFDLSDWDLQETGIPLPENYYPKINNIQDVVDPENEVNYQTWLETYLCPECGQLFTVENSNY